MVLEKLVEPPLKFTQNLKLIIKFEAYETMY